MGIYQKVLNFFGLSRSNGEGEIKIEASEEIREPKANSSRLTETPPSFKKSKVTDIRDIRILGGAVRRRSSNGAKKRKPRRPFFGPPLDQLPGDHFSIGVCGDDCSPECLRFNLCSDPFMNTRDMVLSGNSRRNATPRFR